MNEQEIAKELAELKARVRGLDGANPNAELSPLQKAIAGVNANWHLSARLRVPENTSLVRRAAWLPRRVMRRVVVELLNTIVEQQNAFNAQVARALTELARENAELRARVQKFEGTDDERKTDK